MVDNYHSIDDLIKDSPIIVSGMVDSKNNEFKYADVSFSLTKFRVETIFRGAVPDEINIIQTRVAEDPFIRNGDKMILFLIKYVGPVAQDAYRIKGLFQGQYKTRDDHIIKSQDNNLTGDETLKNIETLKSRIYEIGYDPVTTRPVSQ
jgi:hypothetical protein